jgi:transcriptional regulator with XRE-family HTH domain
MANETERRRARAAGKAIERARRARGLSARGLAELADLDFGYVRRIEKGQGASVEVYARLAALLGIDLGTPLSLVHASGAPAPGSSRSP